MSEDIKGLFSRLDRDSDIDAIRADIADAIAKRMNEHRDNFDYWAKLNFGYAIAALAWNVHSGDRQSTLWLRYSLVSLEKALVPPEARAKDSPPPDQQIEALTFEQLMADLRKLGAKG